jgi:ubiquinone/menaquinone biosynthesis C-methylase UbiE
MSEQSAATHPPHTCPWWLGYLLASPVRRLVENPDRLILPLVHENQRVLELGPGLGFFTVPVARTLGAGGRLVCVDVQKAMLDRLGRRLAQKGLRERVELRLCSQDDLGLDELASTFDLALAIHVVHETPSPVTTVTALARSLRPGGRLLLLEPAGHCSRELYQAETAAAERAGLMRVADPPLPKRRLLSLWTRPS